jgi:hypothetical protein
MSQVIIPKSDQWNADDFIAGPATFTIQEVRISPGSEQPVSIVLEGTNKFYRPCKSMSRVLVQAWGPDARKYVGRSLTLYRDPTVKWAGMEIGGIRISHLSHIDGAKNMMLTATKGSRKPFKVLPLVMQQQPAAPTDAATNWANGFIAKLPTFETADALKGFIDEKEKKLAELATARPALHQQVSAAIEARFAALGALGTSTFEDDDLTTGPEPSDDASECSDEDDQPAAAGGQSLADQIADRPGEQADAFSLEPVAEETGPSPAEQAVDKVIAGAKAAKTSEALEKIIADTEPHKAAMPEALQTKLEIAFDKERQRFVTEGAK